MFNLLSNSSGAGHWKRYEIPLSHLKNELQSLASGYMSFVQPAPGFGLVVATVVWAVVDVDAVGRADGEFVGGDGLIVVASSPLFTPFRNIPRMVLIKGYFPWPQIPLKSSVSIDQTIAPPKFRSFTNFAFNPMLSMSS